MRDKLIELAAATTVLYLSGFLVVCGGVHAAQWLGVL